MPPPPHRRFLPSCEPLDRRDLPAASGWIAAAWGVYAIYASPPVSAVRKIALGGKIGRLAWTGQAKFAFGLVRISHPYALGRADRFRRLIRSRHAVRDVSPERVAIAVVVGLGEKVKKTRPDAPGAPSRPNRPGSPG